MDAYSKKVLDWIMKSESDVYYIEKLVHPDNRDKFIEAIRNIMANNLDFKNNFEIDFGNDFTRFRIIHITGFKTKITGRNQTEGNDNVI